MRYDIKLKFLHLEDVESDADLIRRYLLKRFTNMSLLWVDNKIEFEAALSEFDPDVIISDHSLPGFNSVEALKIARDKKPHIPFILLTATISEEFAVTMLKSGADDYILKDRMQRLSQAIWNSVEIRRSEYEKNNYFKLIFQNERKFRGLIENSNDLIALLDEGLNIIYCSPNYERITGWKPDEIGTQDSFMFIHPDDTESVLQSLNQAIKNPGLSIPLDCRLQHKAGHLLWVEGTLKNMLTDDAIAGIICNVRDVTRNRVAQAELKIAHERLLFHVENAPVGFVEWDNNIKMKSWSKRSQEIFGWTEDEFKQQQEGGYSPVYTEDVPLVDEIGKELTSGNVSSNHVVHRNYKKNGDVIWCEWFNSVLKNENGKVATIMSLVQDVTNRKMAEDSLQKSEANLNAIIENTEDYIYSIDSQFRYIIFNNPLKKIMKETYDIDITPGMKVIGFLGPENKKEIAEWESTYSLVMKGRAAQFTKDYSYETRNVFINFSLNPIWQDGRVTGISCFARDVTEKYIAQEKLRDSESRFRAMIENSYDAIVLRDKNFNLLYCSPSALNILGLKSGKVDFFEGIHPADRTQMEEYQKTILENPGRPVSMTFRKKHAEGHFVWLEGFMTNMLENAAVNGIISNFRDVTEKRKAEEDKTALVQQLTSQNNDLMQFSFIASHNLRGPVASLLGLVSLFDPREVAGESAALLPHLKASARSLDSVVRDISEILTVRTGTDIVIEKINILDALEATKALLEIQIAESHATFDFTEVTVSEIYTIKAYLLSILYNLVSNALKFRSPLRVPHIAVKTKFADNGIIIVISDNGTGIDLDKYRDKLFRLYHRFNLSVEGKGMGLYLVKTQLQSMNGSIAVTSVVGEGTTFTIGLKDVLKS